jgi:hypothetical protein
MNLLDPNRELSKHPVDVGQRSEGAILGALIRRGFAVLVPFGVNQRYDMVVDLGGKFVRAQCKTGRLRKGSVIFSTRSIRSNTQKTIFRSYQGEADVFLVFCAELDQVYVVPVEETPPGGHMYLRVDPTANNQSQRINWARDFELPA